MNQIKMLNNIDMETRNTSLKQIMNNKKTLMGMKEI